MSATSLASVHLQQEDTEVREESKSRCKVNRKFVPIKIVYFTYFAGQSSLLYRSVFAKHLGLSSTQNGLVWAIDRTLGIFFPPILGAISDKSRKPKAVIRGVFSITMILFAAMYFIPMEETGGFQPSCFNSTCYQRHQPTGNTSNCQIANGQSWQHCSPIHNATNITFIVNQTCFCVLDDTQTVDEYGATFWAYLVLSVLNSLAMFGVYCLLDAFVLNKFTAKDRHNYGKNRLFGSLGFGGGALLIGLIKDQLTELGLEGNVPYIPFAFLPPLFWSILQVALCFIDSSPAEKSNPANFAQLKIIFADIRMVAFMLLMIVLGYDISVGENYLFWYAEEKFDAQGSTLGLSVAISTCFDVIMFLLSGRIVKKVGSNLTLSVGIFLLGIRLLFYTATTQAWHLVAVEALRGVVWAVTWVACCNYISDTTPPELRATTMGTVNAFAWGIGYGSGSLLGGVMYQNLGADNMFRISFAFSSITTVVYLAFYLCYERPRKKMKDCTEDKREEVLKLKDPDPNHCSEDV